MAKVKVITLGAEDRLSVVKYHSVGPSVQLTVEVEDGEDPDKVFADAQSQLEDMYKKALCQRLWKMIDAANRHRGPMPDPWAMSLYDELFQKHFAGSDGGSK